MQQALKQAREGRVHILGIMTQTISTNGSLSQHAPLIEQLVVSKDKIRDIIGPGGKIIKEICEITTAKIDIDDDGNVTIAAIGREKLNDAINRIKEIAIEPKIGEVFEGKVVKILDAGAFVNYRPNRDGFVHISEIAKERIESVSHALQEGQIVCVKIIGFERGKAKLTIKNANNDETPERESSSKKERPHKDNFPREKEEPAQHKKRRVKKSPELSEEATSEIKHFR
jgi:polyribonucleotide nucleotidyltransferase